MTEPNEPVDAEIVETPAPAPLPAPTPDPYAAPAPDYTPGGVPTFDYVRDKIEGRAATAAGTTELSGATAAARSLEEQEADRAAAAKAKLDEIRRSLGQQ